MIGALDGGVKKTIQQIERILGKGDWGKTVGEMQKTILIDSKSIIPKVLSGLVQTETDWNILGYVYTPGWVPMEVAALIIKTLPLDFD